MAHNITFNSFTGKHEVMTRGAAWHNLGQVVQDAKTWQETAVLAGLDWTISKRQLDFNGIPVPAYGLFRDDLIYHDAEKAFLTGTSLTYEPVQNEFMFAFLDALVENDGGAHYEAAGSLNNGKQVWAMVNLGTAFEIGASGDRFENYLLFTDDRTGNAKTKVMLTSVRVVCANTLAQALGRENAEETISFVHSKSIHDKMIDAVELIQGAVMNVEILRDKLRRLSERQMTRETLVEALERLFPAADEKQANSRMREDKMKAILDLYEHNDHNQFPEIRGTAYNMLNAVTEYTDHFAPIRRTDSKIGMTDDAIRSEKALFGGGVDFKGSALDMILEVTANNPAKTRTIFTGGGAKAVQEIELEAQPSQETGGDNGYGSLLADIIDGYEGK